MGQTPPLGSHLNRAMDNGLTEAEAGEVLRHTAYYVGWPRVISGVAVIKVTVEGREVPVEVAGPAIRLADVSIVSGAEFERQAGPAENFTGAGDVRSRFRPKTLPASVAAMFLSPQAPIPHGIPILGADALCDRGLHPCAK